MKVSFLKNSDVNEFSKLAKSIILDVPYYSSLAKKCEIKNYEPSKIRLKLKDKNNMFIVVKNKNKIIGFCNGHFDCGTFWVEWAGVEKEFRRKGLCVDMIRFLENKLKKSNVHKVWCDCRINNKESILSLKRLKFKKFALLKKHWYKQNFYLWYKFI